MTAYTERMNSSENKINDRFEIPYGNPAFRSSCSWSTGIPGDCGHGTVGQLLYRIHLELILSFQALGVFTGD